YRLYRRKFIKAELTPDVVDKAALNIYIYLKSLLKDTRYQRKNISFFDVIVIIFPYNLLSDLFFTMVFFFMVFVYILLFKDLDLYLIRVKKTEVRNKKIKKRFDKISAFIYSKINKFYLFIKNNFKLFKNNLRYIFNEFIAFCKKIYEKIFR